MLRKLRNADLRRNITAVKLGESSSLLEHDNKMKKMYNHKGYAGDMYWIAFGVPVGSEYSSEQSESTLHFIYLLGGLTGEHHALDVVMETFHTVVNLIGLRIVRKGCAASDRGRARDGQSNRVPGVNQLVSNEGSIYLLRLLLPEPWRKDLCRVLRLLGVVGYDDDDDNDDDDDDDDDEEENNLSQEETEMARFYARAVLEQCKVGATRGGGDDFYKKRGHIYLWAQPFRFNYIILSGFEDVFRSEQQYGDWLTNVADRHLLGEFFFFASILDMQRSIRTFVTHFEIPNVDLLEIENVQVLERNGLRIPCKRVNLSTITRLIKRGIITADYMEYLMKNNYLEIRYENAPANRNF